MKTWTKDKVFPPMIPNLVLWQTKLFLSILYTMVIGLVVLDHGFSVYAIPIIIFQFWFFWSILPRE